MKKAFFYILIISAFSFATSVTVKKVFGDGGMYVTRVYKTGNFSFGWKIPPHWTENISPTGNLTLVYMPLETNVVSLFLTVSPVSLAETKMESWRVNDLRSKLIKNRFFNITDETFSPVDDTKAWLVSGIETVEVPQTNDTIVLRKIFEKHSYHINQGYLIHIYFKSPFELANKYSKIFNNSLWCFYTVKEENEKDKYLIRISEK